MQPIKQGSFRASLLMFLATMADIYDAVNYSQVYRHLRWPDYPETSVRGMVRRMLKEHELAQTADGYVLGTQGRAVVEGFVPVRKYRQTKWDGLWRVIIYDIPEADKLKRSWLRVILSKYGYGLWQKSVYLSPHPVTAAVMGWLKEKHLFGRVICLESRQAGGVDNRRLAEEIFKSRERLKLWERLVGDGYQVVRNNHGVAPWVRRYEKLIFREPWLPRDLEGAGVEVARHKAAIIIQKLVS